MKVKWKVAWLSWWGVCLRILSSMVRIPALLVKASAQTANTNIRRQASKLDHIVTVQHVAINNHEKSLWHCSACCNPSNGGKERGKQHGPEGSEVRITAQTNVSLEHCLFELMKDEKYQIIHMSHVGLILQITSIWINVLKVCLHINLNKRPLTTSSKNDSRHNTHLRWITGWQQYATLQRIGC